MPIKLPYRPEIDGLRAIAVLPVILYHAGIPGFSGGFVGVDVFFVISGYLITSIILDEYENGGFSFVGFYERRARRILPPLFLVSFACIPFAVYCLSPHDLEEFAKSLLSVCGFVSNVFFWSQSGYFDGPTELKPLIHTWSLAVEEQFYLIFPIALLLLLKLGRRRAIALFVATAILSFALAVWGSRNAPSATFYLLPARYWELLIGALLPLCRIEAEAWRLPRPLVEILALLGLALIAIPIFTYHNIPYPGVYTLPPTLGTALAIVFLRSDTVSGRIVATRVLVGVGLISYSAYLWHQPVFAFARLGAIYEANIPVFVGLSALSLLLAYLTYVLIERPVRDRKRITRNEVFAYCGVASAGLAALGLVGVFTGGLETSYLARNDMATQRAYALIKQYGLRDIKARLIDNGCQFWSPRPDEAFEARFKSCAEKYGPATMVVGDSHGENVYNAVAKAKPGEFVVGLVNEGCRAWNDTDACPYSRLKDFLERNGTSVRGIVFNVSGAHLMTDLKGFGENHHLFEWRTGFLVNFEKVAFTINYLRTIAPLAKIVWLGPFVEARVNFRDPPSIARDAFRMNPVALHHFKVLDAEIAKEVGEGSQTFRYLPFTDVLKVDQSFLLTGDCLTFSDPDHLSSCGEELLGEKLKAHLPWPNS